MDALTPSPLDQIPSALHKQGWALISADTLLNTLHTDQATLDALHASWHDLPPDQHLRDGGHYRFRRHSCFKLDTATGNLTQTPHRAHWQPVTYNALHGGFERLFQPIEPAVCTHPM